MATAAAFFIAALLMAAFGWGAGHDGGKILFFLFLLLSCASLVADSLRIDSIG